MSRDEERKWERHWQRFEPVDFLRTDPFYFNHPSRIMIADEAAKIGGTVLECGSATCIDYPIHKEKGLQYSAIDITPKYIARAKELYPEIDARVASVLDLPFQDMSVNTVYCRALLEHLHPNEWPIAVREMWRVASRQMIVVLYRKKAMEQLETMFTAHHAAIGEKKRDHQDLKVCFTVGTSYRVLSGLEEVESRERGIVFATAIPEEELLDLFKELPHAEPYRHLESPEDGLHKIHHIYIVPKS